MILTLPYNIVLTTSLQQNVLERHAQILKDPSNGAKMVKVQIARSFPPSDNCLLLQMDESKNKLQFLLERTRMDLNPATEEVIVFTAPVLCCSWSAEVDIYARVYLIHMCSS